MLATTVRLHDIDDVEGFVCGTLERSGLSRFLGRAEHEELVAEGIVLLYKLAEKYEPQRPGYAQAGRFSGFASQFLPRRLGDVWHRAHPEHTRVVGADGRRRWAYRKPPLSFDRYLEIGNSVSPSNVETRIRPLAEQAPPPRPTDPQPSTTA